MEQRTSTDKTLEDLLLELKGLIAPPLPPKIIEALKLRDERLKAQWVSETRDKLRVALKECVEALDSVWAAIGDALCSGKGINKPYAQSVTNEVDKVRNRARAALASAPSESERPAPLSEMPTDVCPDCTLGPPNWAERKEGYCATCNDTGVRAKPLDSLSALSQKWRVIASERCAWCKAGWDLGAHGCHFEPPSKAEENDDYGGMTENCKAFRLRRCADELDAALAKIGGVK